MDPPTSLVLGEEGCTIKDVVDIFCNEANSAAVFDSWRNFARELRINPGQIKQLNQDILLDKSTVEDALHGILESWKSEKGKDATLANLLTHLEKVKLKNVADDLRKFFSTKNRIPKDGALFKVTLPTKLKYYIPRTLITRNVIDTEVFSSTHKDVFVVHGGGIERYRLSQLANKGLTDTSTSQVRKDKLSVRFILLERFGDWGLLCGKTTHPIHLLRHHEGRFHWICTKGDIYALQKASDEKTQNELSEEEFIQEIENDLQFQTNQPICISDSPGMGKSLLLASIGRQLQKNYPERFIAFIVISEFAVKVRALLAEHGDKALLEVLLQTLCENTWTREHLLQKMSTPAEDSSTQIELMFDGFDEVSSENFTLAHECLENLRANFNSTIRLWVTTRPQHLHELEKRFSVLGHNIQAFQEKNQIDFLTSFWNNQQKNLDGSKLQLFSKNCLSTLKEKLNKKDEDIAGIPLQCMIIAEVYSNEAHRFCDPINKRLENSTESSVCFDINSIADFYEKMIAHKFEKFIETYPLKPEEIRNIWPLHMYHALQLIFPLLIDEFKDTLQIGTGLESGYLLNVGILERKGSRTETEEPARFIHRTFAEYLAARYFVLYAIAPSTIDLENANRKLPDFLFEEVLECSVTKGESRTKSYYKCSFKHSVLCHFLDTMLGAQKLISTENSISRKPTHHIKDVIYACIHSDFGNIIQFLRSLRYPESFGIGYMYLDLGILIDATTLASLDLLKFLLQKFEHKPLTTIDDTLPKASYLPPTTLHAAVLRGSYTVFEYILNGHDFEDLVKEDKRFLDLVHWAVEDTTDRDLVEIRDRVQILTALCDINKEILNYCDDYEKTPLLAYCVNILLLKKLIELGANLLHVDKDKNTILHSSARYLFSTDYYELLQFIPNTTLISLIQMCNKYDAPSLCLIVECGLLTPNILNVILSSGFDLNTSEVRSSITYLYYAMNIQNEDRRIASVKLLLENGVDFTSVDRDGNSILHHSAREGRVDCLRFFLEEKNMNVNQINAYENTPIFSALQNKYSALETVQFLLERGADYKILNSNQQTVLHYAVDRSELKCLQLFLSLGGLDINQADDDGDTPLLFTLRKNSYVESSLWDVWEREEEAVEVIRLLLSKGADHTISNKKGNNVLHHLAEFGKADCFSPFDGLPSLDVNAKNCEKDAPLHLVFKNIDNYDEICDDFKSLLHNTEKLLSLGADVNLKNGDGKTPLDIYQQQILESEVEEELMEKDLTIRRLLEGKEKENHPVKENAQ